MDLKIDGLEADAGFSKWGLMRVVAWDGDECEAASFSLDVGKAQALRDHLSRALEEHEAQQATQARTESEQGR